MNNLYFIITFFILLLTYFLLIKYHLGSFKVLLSGDALNHFKIYSTLKNSIKKKYIDGALIKNLRFSYPKLFHITLLIYPRNFLKKFSYIPNLIFFILAIIIVNFTLSDFLFHNTNLKYLFLFLIFFPLRTFIKDDITKVYFFLSERFFGSLLCNLYILIFYIYTNENSSLLFFVLYLINILALNSSKFSRQVLFLFSIFSIPFFGIINLIILILSTLTSLLIDYKFFKLSLKMQYLHLKNYFRKISDSVYMQDNKKKFNITLTIKKKFYRFIKQNNYIYGIIRNIEFFLCLTFLIYLQNETVLKFYFIFFIMYFFTSLRFLNFLGESYRYLEFGLTFMNGYIIILIFQENIFFIKLLLFVYLLIIIFTLIKILSKNYKSKDQSYELLTFDIKSDDNLISMPAKLSIFFSCYRNCNFFWWQFGNFTEEVYERFFDNYPLFKNNIIKLTKEFKINKLIVSKNFLKQNKIKLNKKNLKLIMSSSNYELYKII